MSTEHEVTRLPLKVINLWGGPGSGKSTTAAGLFNLMKSRGESVELVTEVAKDFTWDRAQIALGNQILVLGMQDHRLRRLVGQVEWAITDSPLPLSCVYAPDEYKPWIEQAALGAFRRYDNAGFLLERTAAYRKEGRNEDAEEARRLDTRIKVQAYAAHGRVIEPISGDNTAVYYIASRLGMRRDVE